MKIRKILVGLILIGLIFFYTDEISAHGVGYRQSELKSLPLEFFYSTGEKMSYREARVFSPKDSKFAVQSGRTDEEGRFAFIPDTVGEWKVIVRDEEGHQCEAKINITEEFLSDSEHSVKADENFLPSTEILIRALLGVSLIFNIAMLIKIRKRSS